jgi:hypothetical protein
MNHSFDHDAAQVSRNNTEFHSLPVWLAVLVAVHCKEHATTSTTEVKWLLEGNCAVFRNGRQEPVVLEPFDLLVNPGGTVFVEWEPGMTSYSIRAAA